MQTQSYSVTVSINISGKVLQKITVVVLSIAHERSSGIDIGITVITVSISTVVKAVSIQVYTCYTGDTIRIKVIRQTIAVVINAVTAGRVS
jgi:hypothetical protein